MAQTLRTLLVQRAARLQGRPALTAPGWGTLSWSAWRNRVEAVGFGLLAGTPPPAVQARTGTPWDWAAEVAAACCGLAWDEAGAALDDAFFTTLEAHAETGRGPYHRSESCVLPETPFSAGLDHAALLLKLQRLNRSLEWDHRTELRVPLSGLGTPEARAALWSVLYAGGHARLGASAPGWDPLPFRDFWMP